ncbi:MAG: hypothetical protein AB1Z98_17910 [Nannocystaceae bacterium]
MLRDDQRRMLLEMLVSERSGEDALHVGRHFGRDRTASSLCGLRMSNWVDESHIVFTSYGRQLAEWFAERLVGCVAAAELCS